jgi:acyl dehydratase
MDVGLFFEEYSDDWSFDTGTATVTDDSIRAFASLHAFNTPTYTDPRYMTAAYGGRMAPGLHIVCLAEGLVLDAGLTRRRGIFLLELTPKFMTPVFAGDAITNHIHLKSKRLTSKSDRGIVVTRHKVITHRGEVAIEYDAVRMIRTKNYLDIEAMHT